MCYSVSWVMVNAINIRYGVGWFVTSVLSVVYYIIYGVGCNG